MFVGRTGDVVAGVAALWWRSAGVAGRATGICQGLGDGDASRCGVEASPLLPELLPEMLPELLPHGRVSDKQAHGIAVFAGKLVCHWTVCGGATWCDRMVSWRRGDDGSATPDAHGNTGCG